MKYATFFPENATIYIDGNLQTSPDISELLFETGDSINHFVRFMLALGKVTEYETIMLSSADEELKVYNFTTVTSSNDAQKLYYNAKSVELYGEIPAYFIWCKDDDAMNKVFTFN